MGLLIPRLYAIIDPARAGGRSPAVAARELYSAGVRLIQFRDKHASSRQLYETCVELKQLLRDSGCYLIVNDRADVARAANADGVHLGQGDLPVEMARRVLAPEQWIGCSTHSLEQVVEGDRTTADYIAFGPIFPTTSKESPDPVVGLEGLREARRATGKPLVAIGGITLQNACEVVAAGADSVAVIGDLLNGPDLRARAREFLSVLRAFTTENTEITENTYTKNDASRNKELQG
jgi:thiamine-phosphate pyrophosphorylase